MAGKTAEPKAATSKEAGDAYEHLAEHGRGPDGYAYDPHAADRSRVWTKQDEPAPIPGTPDDAPGVPAHPATGS